MSPRGRPQARVRSVPWPDDVVDEVLQLEAEYDQHSGPMTSDERAADRADVATRTGIVALVVGLISAVVAVAAPGAPTMPSGGFPSCSCRWPG